MRMDYDSILSIQIAKVPAPFFLSLFFGNKGTCTVSSSLDLHLVVMVCSGHGIFVEVIGWVVQTHMRMWI